MITFSSPIAAMFGQEHRWVLMQQRDGRRKLPLSIYRTIASVSDPSTWAGLDRVLRAMSPRAYGEGTERPAIVLMNDLLVVDFDHALNGPWCTALEAAVLLARYPSYAEISMSLAGLHVYYLLTQRWSTPKQRIAESIEVYTDKRFMSHTAIACTLVGNRVSAGESYPLMTITPEQAEDILRLLGWQGDVHRRSEPEPQPRAVMSASDQEVLLRAEKMFGARFSALYSGDISGYQSHSEADAAFVAMLSRVSSDRDQIERIWLVSPLGAREKTQQRADYRKRTLDFVGAGDPSRVIEERRITEQYDRALMVMYGAHYETIDDVSVREIASRMYRAGVRREVAADVIEADVRVVNRDRVAELVATAYRDQYLIAQARK
ncbi:MAG: hypothetical protein N2545_07985 [Thermoflexales bacterium]|nr:hypothetical protein [Thermoflexales bacterium]